MNNIIVVVLCLVMAMTLIPDSGHAALSFDSPVTFDCTAADWTYPSSCGGVETAGAYACGPGVLDDANPIQGTAGSTNDAITSAANYSGGGGGNGWRHYIGDGKNNNGQGMNVPFATPAPEFYFRWYMRYPTGFAWNFLGYQKLIYTNPHSNVVDFASDNWTMTNQGTSDNRSHTGNGWFATQASGGTTSDGAWHAYEVHLKSEVSGNDGVIEVWIDGTQIWSLTNVNLDTSNNRNFTSFGVLTNQNRPSNSGTCTGVDVDDIVLSASYIGPIGGSGSSFVGSGGMRFTGTVRIQ